MTLNWLHVVLVSYIIAQSSAKDTTENNYCKLSKLHTMCRLNSAAPHYRCGTSAFSKGFDDKDKEMFLRTFNSKRDLIAAGIDVRESGTSSQPSASNMLELEWDNELERVAQRWADQCLVNRNDEERSVIRFPQVGQLVYASGFLVEDFQSDLDRSIHHWFGQVDNFDPEMINKFDKKRVAKMDAMSYTQAAWATTQYIGCGRTIFSKNMSSKNMKQRTKSEGKKSARQVEYKIEIIVCNLAPGGNQEGEPVYLIGDGASACPTGLSPDIAYSGLCSDKAIHDKRHSNGWVNHRPFNKTKNSGASKSKSGKGLDDEGSKYPPLKKKSIINEEQVPNLPPSKKKGSQRAVESPTTAKPKKSGAQRSGHLCLFVFHIHLRVIGYYLL